MQALRASCALVLLAGAIGAASHAGSARASPSDAQAASPAATPRVPKPRSPPEFTWTRLAPRTWMLALPPAVPGASNGGAVINHGVIGTDAGLVLVDPGPTPEHAAALVRAVERRLASRVRWVVDSHPQAVHVLGNAGLPADVQIVATRAVDRVMRERCPACAAQLAAALGTPARAFPLRHADRVVEAGTTLRFGDRSLLLLGFDDAQSRANAAVWDPDTRVLFAPGLVTAGVVPDLRDADVARWIAALRTLEALGPRRVVPGQGADASPASLASTLGYLDDLRRAADADVAAGGASGDAGARLGLRAYRAWPLYAERHGLNAQRLHRLREDAAVAAGR